MTKLLVSVRNVEEAQAALRGGADLIDVKEPTAGSLGAASAATWQSIRESLPENISLSAALGELMSADLEQGKHLDGFQFAKVGLMDCDEPKWTARWSEFETHLPSGTKTVAVIYADWQAARAPKPSDVLQFAVEHRCSAVLIDTWTKTAGNLLDHLSNEDIQTLVDAAKHEGMISVLGGSISVDILSDALRLRPDFLAVRGTVCPAGRESQLEMQRVSDLRNQMRLLETVML